MSVTALPAGPGRPRRFILTPYFLDRGEPLLEELASPEWVLNRPLLPPGDQLARVAAVYRPLAELVVQALEAGQVPVSIAGDCVSSLGVLAGLQRQSIRPTLIWFDAHGDFNTPQTTPSGFLGGMPLAMLVGRGEQAICAAIGLEPLSERQVILTDARDLDPGEAVALAHSQVVHLPKVTQLLHYPLPAGPLWVHVDTDVLDPAEAPAMSYPAPGGPSAATLGRVFHHLAQTGRMVAVSVSTWNPALDDGQSRQTCLEVLAGLL